MYICTCMTEKVEYVWDGYIHVCVCACVNSCLYAYVHMTNPLSDVYVHVHVHTELLHKHTIYMYVIFLTCSHNFLNLLLVSSAGDCSSVPGGDCSGTGNQLLSDSGTLQYPPLWECWWLLPQYTISHQVNSIPPESWFFWIWLYVNVHVHIHIHIYVFFMNFCMCTFPEERR